MTTRWAALFLVGFFAVGAPASRAQEEEVKLTFNFRDARVDDVLDYVSKATGWKFVFENAKSPTGTITAVSDGAVSGDQALVILDTALRQHGLATVNMFAPRLPRKGETVKVVPAGDAMKKTLEVHYGSDPDSIAPTDKVITQIITLKGANVVDVQKDLGDTLKKCLEPDGTLSLSTYSNSLVLTGRSDGIRRAALILQIIDVKTSEELKTRIFALKNADATETTKILGEVFKKETQAAQRDASPFGRMFEFFGQGRKQPDQGPTPKTVASEIVRIVADTRTNSVICVATQDNLKTIQEVVDQLDGKSAELMKLKLYPLQYADADQVAKVITEIFSEQGASSSQQKQQSGNPFRPMFMGPQPPQSGDKESAVSREVRAVTDTRTNSVVVAASEKNFLLIDDLVRNMDRQVSDILTVKIYELKNADAKEMATSLQDIFRPQINATQAAGRTTGATSQQGGNRLMQMFGGGGGGVGGSAGGGSLPPSQEMEISSDTRTNSVIAKASGEYIKIIDTIVEQLDRNPTEAKSTYAVQLRNADAATVAKVLQDLLRGTSSTTSTQLQSTNLPGLSSQLRQGSNQQSAGSTRSGNSGSQTRRGGNLGPIEGEQEESLPLQQDPDPRRGIEGQVDVQADPATNTLVLRTSPRNYAAIEGLIQNLDRLRPQVLIKVLIADVTLNDNMQFGVEGFWENKFHTKSDETATNRLGTDFNLASQGFTYTLTGDEFGATLNMFAEDGMLKILATPRILVLDNQTANINVGKEVPVITNTQVNQLGNTVNTVRYENVGILLQVTPHINPDGLVTMIVHPEVSDIASQAESVQITNGVTSPTFIVNSADTTVAVRNGQTVIIGGLIREVVDESREGLPILSDIPILGLLFSSTTKKKSKRELMIFLTPYVAYTTTELEELTELEKSKLKLIDQKDIEAESDKWIERVRH